MKQVHMGLLLATLKKKLHLADCFIHSWKQLASQLHHDNLQCVRTHATVHTATRRKFNLQARSRKQAAATDDLAVAEREKKEKSGFEI